MARSRKHPLEIQLQRAKKIRGGCRAELKEEPSNNFRQEQLATWDKVVADLEVKVSEINNART